MAHATIPTTLPDRILTVIDGHAFSESDNLIVIEHGTQPAGTFFDYDHATEQVSVHADDGEIYTGRLADIL